MTEESQEIEEKLGQAEQGRRQDRRGETMNLELGQESVYLNIQDQDSSQLRSRFKLGQAYAKPTSKTVIQNLDFPQS